MPVKTVGLICAIPEERDALKATLDHGEATQIAGLGFSHGEIEGQPIVLAEAGIGKVNTAMVATLLATRFEVDILAFSGVAGGLDPNLHIGDLVIADRAIQHDCGVIENDRLEPYQAGHVPFFNPTDDMGYAARSDMIDSIKAALADLAFPPLAKDAGGSGDKSTIVYGAILAGDQYIHCETTRTRLQARFDAKAVAMEGGAMAQVAERFGLPWLSLIHI